MELETRYGERMVLKESTQLEDGEIIQPEHLPSFISQRQGEFQVFSDGEATLDEVEKRYIQFILRRTKGKRQDAAKILGINRKTLAQKIENPKSVNLVVLGFALARAGQAASDHESLFCSFEDIKAVLKSRFAKNKKMLDASLTALQAGYEAEAVKS